MPENMPAVAVATLICGIIALIIFIAGYVRGFQGSIVDFDTAAESTLADKSSGWGWLVPLAVIASGVVIALMGVHPTFISLVPFLSIGSAATIGLLFFIEPHLDKGRRE